MQWLFKTPGHDSLEIFSTKINARLKFEHSNWMIKVIWPIFNRSEIRNYFRRVNFHRFFYFTGMSHVPTFQQRVELIGAKIDFPRTVSKQFEEGLQPKTEKVEKRIDFGTFWSRMETGKTNAPLFRKRAFCCELVICTQLAFSWSVILRHNRDI